MEPLSSRLPWQSRPLTGRAIRPSIRMRFGLGTAIALALLLHGLALLTLVRYTPTLTTEAAGRPASGTSVQVTLISAPAPTPTPAPTPVEPKPVAKPVTPRHAAPRRAPVLASDRSQSQHRVNVEPAPDTTPAPDAVAEPSAPATPEAATTSAAAAQRAPAAASRELDLPGSQAVKDVARIVCHFGQPPYPSVARRLHHEGTVTLRVTIDAAGKPSQVDVDTSSGFPELDAAAVQTLRAGQCEPYLDNGRPASVRAVQPLTFNLTH